MGDVGGGGGGGGLGVVLLRNVRVGFVQDVGVGRGADVMVISQAVIIEDCRDVGVSVEPFINLEYSPVPGLCS